VGDNTDATIVIDEEGYLYVARHKSHNITSRVNPKADTLGSLMKLDPRKPNDPVVWSTHVGSDDLLGTPALYQGEVYAESTDGTLIALDADTGNVTWRLHLPGPMENSPVPIDGKLLVGDCAGVLHLYDIADPKAKPKKVWELNLGGCIESTPAVWHGWIWVGTRAGAFYGISDPA
jgi:outer membrane protein assembly factor BamB